LDAVEKEDPALLLVYSFHMHMAICAGGAIIRRMARKAMDLPKGCGKHNSILVIDENPQTHVFIPWNRRLDIMLRCSRVLGTAIFDFQLPDDEYLNTLKSDYRAGINTLGEKRGEEFQGRVRFRSTLINIVAPACIPAKTVAHYCRCWRRAGCCSSSTTP
jgi:hypothetical protein